MLRQSQKGEGLERSIVLAEPLALVREGLAALCESSGDYRVVGLCEDGESAAAVIAEQRPDFAILDLQLQRLFTLEVIRKSHQAQLPTRFVVIGTRTDRKTVTETLKGGASAYVLKSGPGQHLMDALSQIEEGRIYVSPLLDLQEIFIAKKKSGPDDPVEQLSAREHQVFSLLVEGVRAKEIAAQLELSPKTVDTYRANLMRKLNIYDVAGLVKYAIHRNLIPTP